MSTALLHEAVRNSFPAPTFLYMREVRDATGFDAVRSADGIAVGMYRSCGRQVHGFEMKVSRTDWLKELAQPAKAESLMRYCHRWALIVPDASIVKDGELPVTWGLGVPERTRKNALVRVKWIVKPPELTPIPFSMVFLTALLYAATKVDETDLKKRLEAEFQQGKKMAEDRIASQAKFDNSETLRKAVEAFEAASGVRITGYTAESTATRAGTEFKEYQESRRSIDNFTLRLGHIRESVKRLAEDVDNRMRDIEKANEVSNVSVA